MEFEEFSFGSIRIDGMTYEHDVVIDGGKVHKRSKKTSKQFGSAFGHTPLSMEEDMPWKCRRLVIGTGVYGHLPVMKEVKLAAAHRQIELLILPTAQAIGGLKQNPDETNAILTCYLLRNSRCLDSEKVRETWSDGRIPSPQTGLCTWKVKAPGPKLRCARFALTKSPLPQTLLIVQTPD